MSSKLIDDMERLAIQSGVILKRYNKRFKLSNMKEIKIKDKREKHISYYKGKVYCIRVNSGIFIVKENNKITFTGNSRAGQKGVVAAIVPEYDMPFTISGLRPDIIVNALAIPSRMTINQIIETVSGKISCYEDENIDGTSFSKVDTTELSNKLIQHGFHPSGEEVMFNGMTGEMFKCNIFIGVTYYQRLKHLVSDKIHARNKGALNSLTRSPTAGRKNLGGGKTSTQECDAIMASGLSSFMRERMMIKSDLFHIHICSICGQISNKITFCSFCNSEVYKVSIPYISKLIFQELMAMGIKMKFALTN